MPAHGLAGRLKDAAQRAGTTFPEANTGPMTASARDMLDLELALLRRGLDERLAGSERCTCCHRTPLVGERVYLYASGTIACELCRGTQRDVPEQDRIVHGPEFGHTMRIIDQRAAA
jgi:hypothetical protein